MELDRLVKQARRRPLFDPSGGGAERRLGRPEIEALIPHRDPILLVDRISAYDLTAETLQAHRHVDPDDPVFRGHFPDYPVYPGALLIEAIGQASLCLQELIARDEAGVADITAASPQPLRLLRVREALFQAEVRPGDDLTIRCRRLEHDAFTVSCIGQAFRGETICAVAVLEVYFVDEDG
jgi:3-hydroxymyristoyl/3-hydroxydecanoyl-(acyl carrier protein) dehydratase